MIKRCRKSIVCYQQSLRLSYDIVVGKPERRAVNFLVEIPYDFLTGVILGDSCKM